MPIFSYVSDRRKNENKKEDKFLGPSAVLSQFIVGRLVHETATYRCDHTRGCVMQF